MKRKGFTIIEVVLVLAIAGLIFLMVFLALPALQRSQRNEQRRETLNKIYALIPQYQKNNHGHTPFNATTGEFDTKFITNYVDSGCNNPRTASDDEAGGAGYGGWVFSDCGSEFSDPDGTPYIVGHMKSTDSTPDYHGVNHVIYFGAGMVCRGETNVSDDTSVDAAPNSFVVMMMLEGGAIYCVDNASSIRN